MPELRNICGKKLAQVNYDGFSNSAAGEKIATKTASKFPPFFTGACCG